MFKTFTILKKLRVHVLSLSPDKYCMVVDVVKNDYQKNCENSHQSS